MTEKRSSGIVLSVSSLPGRFGIGSVGAPAKKFVDFLVEAGQSHWQVLPLCPTGFGDSPYQSCSSAAGNPYFIDLPALVEKGLLKPEELPPDLTAEDPDYVDYGDLFDTRFEVLKTAYTHAKQNKPILAAVADFAAQNADWLDDYALFMAIKEKFNMTPLRDWPDEKLLARDTAALKKARKDLADHIGYHAFVQYCFWTQWEELRAYAKEKGISIIGDLPIYVSEDSVEVWTHPELFRLSSPGKPAFVAGVPPDLYSATGQLWGNPLYNWDAHKKQNYRWWIERLKRTLAGFDIIRIDHFRGFYNYWSIPYGAETAVDGEWTMGPGLPFVEAVKAALPAGSLIAEDLGEIDAEVRAFFKQTGLPGMKILVFGFDPWKDNEFLPHNTHYNTVSYTSSHDSATFAQWLHEDANAEERQYAYEYLRLRDDEGIGWGAVRGVWQSHAFLAMAMMQDILGLGFDARMNIPATFGGRNWAWRIRAEALNSKVAQGLYHLTNLYKRLPVKEEEPVVETIDNEKPMKKAAEKTAKPAEKTEKTEKSEKTKKTEKSAKPAAPKPVVNKPAPAPVAAPKPVEKPAAAKPAPVATNPKPVEKPAAPKPAPVAAKPAPVKQKPAAKPAKSAKSAKSKPKK